MINNVERQLIATLLLASGVPLEEVVERFRCGVIKKELSGPIPTTVFTCGQTQRMWHATGSVIAEMQFQSEGCSVEWLLHRYPNSQCEIEVLVNSNLNPWKPAAFPKKIELFVSPVATE